MEKYKKIQPEVIVGLGDNTEFLEQQPPFKTVLNLHLELEDWLGDDLMECHPCYIVTESLKNCLENDKFTGFEFANIEITQNEYFDDNYHINKDLPLFYWLKIIGEKNVDDVFIGEKYTLFANDRFINYLKENFSVNYLDIGVERNEFDDLLDKMIAESKEQSKK